MSSTLKLVHYIKTWNQLSKHFTLFIVLKSLNHISNLFHYALCTLYESFYKLCTIHQPFTRDYDTIYDISYNSM